MPRRRIGADYLMEYFWPRNNAILKFYFLKLYNPADAEILAADEKTGSFHCPFGSTCRRCAGQL
jgi:hypothetical protein